MFVPGFVELDFNRLKLSHLSLQFGAGEVAVAIVDCLEFAAVDGDQIFSEQPQLLTT